MRLIDADALMEIYMDRLSLVADRYSPDSSECGILTGAVKLLDAQPTIEPQREQGEWIPSISISDWKHHEWCGYQCSICGEKTPRLTQHNFCPNCGADMRGEEND